MDALMETVSRLYAQGVAINQISSCGLCSATKARKILITTGQYTTPLISKVNQLYADGLTIAQIAERINLSTKAVNGMLPYSKGIYNAEYPTINAIRVRKSRLKKLNSDSQK